MTITTSTTSGASFLHAAHLLAAHLAEHPLPPSASLELRTRRPADSKLTVQLRGTTRAEIAAGLLSWASTLSVVTAGAWRPPEGRWVHLSLASSLTGPGATAELDVFGGADDHHGWFADLEPGQRRTVSLDQLRTWAASQPGAHAPEQPR
ncbi:MAG: hypothetical protein JO345_04760 [Streptosporangiaceae bacterium]|nr:hypothetical protein [Streptosporangiaceae bacterium]